MMEADLNEIDYIKKAAADEFVKPQITQEVVVNQAGTLESYLKKVGLKLNSSERQIQNNKSKLIESSNNTSDYGSNTNKKWSLDIIFPGTALNLATPLTILQNGEERIFLNARYDTKPFKGSPYYAIRFGKWNNGKGWELDLTHHKLYLENKLPEVQQFEISHGYNLITLNRAWEKDNGLITRVGAGIVVTHPETKIRGKKLPWSDELITLDGFYLSGPAIIAGIEKKFPLWGNFYALAELKGSLAYARIPIADGEAHVPNAALHFRLGIGKDFPIKKISK